jgi:restriction endonuclease S subunit
MAGEWSTAPLEELVDDILDRRGVTPLKLGSDFTSAGHRVISAKLMKESRIDLGADEPRFVDAPTYKKWMQSPLLEDDVILTSEAPLGEIAYIKEQLDWCLGQRLFGIRTNKSKLFGRFLFYALKSEPVFNDLTSRATGTTVQGIRQSELRKVKIPVPPLAEQKAIAAVLGALDDKIELNRRMNATLEAIARALFQSWFVDFDPVRAKMDGRNPTGLDEATAALFPDSFQDSEVGHIPKGWRASSLGEVIDVFDSKRIPLSGREREQRRGSFPYHGAASVMDYVDDYLFDGIYALMGEDGSVINDDGTPVMQYVWGKFWVNNHAHVLRGKNGVCTEHLLLHLKGSNIAAFVTGAVQPKLNQGNMNRIPFMLPSCEVSEAFAKTIEPLFAQIRTNTDQSRTLATLRDTLLPKLLSGELSVPTANLLS